MKLAHNLTRTSYVLGKTGATWQKRANIPIGQESIIWGSLVYYAAADSLFYFGGYIGSDMQDTVFQQRTHEQFGWQWIKALGFMCIFLFCGYKQSVDTQRPQSS